MSEEPAVRELAFCLGTDFLVEAGRQEDVCVDLEGEWREDSQVCPHPDLDLPSLEFVSGAVGEGGDHVNVTFRNTGEQAVTLARDRIALVVKEISQRTEDAETVGKPDGETQGMESREATEMTKEPGGDRGESMETDERDEATEEAVKVSESDNTIEGGKSEEKSEEANKDTEKADKPEEEEKSGEHSRSQSECEERSEETQTETSGSPETPDSPKMRFVNETADTGEEGR